MAFVVNVLKEDKETKKTLNLQFVVDHDSPLFVRKFLQQAWLMILTFKDFYGALESFWPSYISITYDNTTIRIVANNDTPPKKLCGFFKKLGYNIDEVNLFASPLTPEQAKQIIDESDLDIEQERVDGEEHNNSKKKQNEKQLYKSNRKVERCRLVADWIMDKVDTLFYEKKIRMTEKDIRQIKDRVEELKKVKMGANYEKMQNMLQGIMFRLNDIEDEYYRDLNDPSPPLFVWTNVTADELERELSMFDTSEQRKLFGGNPPKTKQYYAILGEPLIYIKFLWKDASIAAKESFPYLYKIFDFFLFVFFGVLILLWISVLLLTISSNTQYLKVVYHALVNLWVVWWLLYLASLVNTKDPKNIIMLIIAIPILYFIILHFIKTTFALY
jgi:hypothetical protein